MTTSSEASSVNRPLEVAFAVGGLGGNNCHGAGFLQAALDTGIKPQLISFTSGQVLWVSRYLAAMADSSPDSILRKQLAEDIEALESFHQPDFDLLFLGLFGKRGAIRPARHEVLLDLIKNITRSFERMIENPLHIFFMKEFLSTLPRLYRRRARTSLLRYQRGEQKQPEWQAYWGEELQFRGWGG